MIVPTRYLPLIQADLSAQSQDVLSVKTMQSL